MTAEISSSISIWVETFRKFRVWTIAMSSYFYSPVTSRLWFRLQRKLNRTNRMKNICLLLSMKSFVLCSKKKNLFCWCDDCVCVCIYRTHELSISQIQPWDKNSTNIDWLIVNSLKMSKGANELQTIEPFTVGCCRQRKRLIRPCSFFKSI